MAPRHPLTVRVDLSSNYEMLDLAQTLTEGLCRELGFDEDAVHWIGVSVRESVANAVLHGNKLHPDKRVFVELAGTRTEGPSIDVTVRDQGDGFDPATIANPLAPENLLKGSGRGIFLIRSFMDDVVIERLSHGGMEMRLHKHAPPASDAPR